MKILLKNKDFVLKILVLFIVIGFFLFYNFNTKDTFNQELTLETDEDSFESSPELLQTEDSEVVNLYLEISGAVKYPGIYSFEGDDVRLFDLVDKAGGFTDANLGCVNQVQILHDEQKIVIPYKSEECDDVTSLTEEQIDNSKININTATSEQLQTLNGIGESKANAIITYREDNGNFQSVDELVNVSGIGESTLSKISDLITI